MKKGITPLIAIIILLLIAIALAFAAWMFLVVYSGALTNNLIQLVFGSEEINRVSLLNVGEADITPDGITLMINGELGEILNPQVIPKGESALFVFYTPVYGKNLEVKFIVSGNTVVYRTDIEPIDILIIDGSFNPTLLNLSNPLRWGGNLVSLGFNVTLDLDADTKEEVDAYEPDIIACIAIFWYCNVSVPLLEDLYNQGYMILTNGNDNTNVLTPALMPIISTDYIQNSAKNTPLIYPDTTEDHPISRGWDQASGSGPDQRYGITSFNGVPIALDTTWNYTESFYLEEEDKGKWFHYHPSRTPPRRILINAMYFMKGYFLV
jgi:flagellin-like protein